MSTTLRGVRLDSSVVRQNREEAMIPLTVNEEIAGVLGGYVDAVEVRDEQGRILGHFMPYLTPEARDFYEHPEKYFDMQEIERIEREERGTGRPLAEFWESMRAAGKAP
jgi:hypothetical protein